MSHFGVRAPVTPPPGGAARPPRQSPGCSGAAARCGAPEGRASRRSSCRLRHSRLLPLSFAGKQQEEQLIGEEEAKNVLTAWRRRRRKVNDVFLALLDLSSHSLLQQERMRGLVVELDELDSSALGSSSASSSARKKKKKRRKRRRKRTTRRACSSGLLGRGTRDRSGSCVIRGETTGVRWDTCAWCSVLVMWSLCVRAVVQSFTATELNNQIHCHEEGDKCGRALAHHLLCHLHRRRRWCDGRGLSERVVWPNRDHLLRHEALF